MEELKNGRIEVFNLSIFQFFNLYNLAKVVKGAWRMPWLTEAMKDVISCDKPGVGANDL